jgi:Ca2+-binding EF-hand superfamily protein
VLSDVLDSVNRKKTSIHQLFTNFDADKSGCLDTAEFRAAMLQISIKLSEFEVGEVMAEIDMDVSGSIDTQVPAE